MRRVNSKAFLDTDNALYIKNVLKQYDSVISLLFNTFSNPIKIKKQGGGNHCKSTTHSRMIKLRYRPLMNSTVIASIIVSD